MAYSVQQIKATLKLYDRLKKVVPTVRQLGYPTAHTLYEWINQREATGGKFPDIEPILLSYMICTINFKLWMVKGIKMHAQL